MDDPDDKEQLLMLQREAVLSQPKRQIILADKTRFQNGYGGLFDLANVRGFTSKQLKLTALFQKHIIVPDAFFFCHGHFFNHLDGLVRDPRKMATNIVTQFLREGVIVPAIRQGDSILALWEQGAEGVCPGQFTAVEMEAGKRVLDYIDQEATFVASWPDNMARSKVAELPRLINRFVLSDDSGPVHRFIRSPAQYSLGQSLDGIEDSIALLSKFDRLIAENLDNPRFRRADIEFLISQHLGNALRYDKKTRAFDPRLYSSVAELVGRSNGRNLNFLACQYVLNAVTTIYEAYHAHQFHTVGGLFASHEEELIDMGLYDSLTGIVGDVLEGDRCVSSLQGEFDVSQLTPEDVLGIRKSHQFTGLMNRISHARFSNQGQEEFADANRAIIEHIVHDYLPYIVREYPRAGRITSNVLAYTGLAIAPADSLFKVLLNNATATFYISDHPIITLVLGVGGGILAYKAENIATFLSQWRMRNSIRRLKNHYLAPTQ